MAALRQHSCQVEAVLVHGCHDRRELLLAVAVQLADEGLHLAAHRLCKTDLVLVDSLQHSRCNFLCGGWRRQLYRGRLLLLVLCVCHGVAP